MNIKNNRFIKLICAYCRRFDKQDTFGLAAEMSFYLFTALFPFVILLFVIATLISTAMQDMLFSLISYLPRDMENVITELIMSFKGSLPIILLSAGLGIWYMGNVILTLTKAINRFYAIKETRRYIRLRIRAMFFAIFIVIIVFLTFALLIFGSGTQHLLTQVPLLKFMDIQKLWDFIRYFLCILVIFFSITLIFMKLPNRKFKFKSVAAGSALTTIAWCITSYGFSFYVTNIADYHVIYGSLASIIVLVTWIYLSAFVILLGASLNAFWHRIHAAKRYNIQVSRQ